MSPPPITQEFFTATNSFHLPENPEKGHMSCLIATGAIGYPNYSLCEQLNTTNTAIPLGPRSASALIPLLEMTCQPVAQTQWLTCIVAI